MGVRTISLSFAAAALLGTAPAIAAATIAPSIAKISLAPVAGTNLGISARSGVRKGKSSDIAAGSAVIAVLAAGAVAGGVVAATDSGGGHSTSP